MTTYLVTWNIDIQADSAEEAARIALDIQRDPESIATVFYVREHGAQRPTFLVDLCAGGEA